MIGSYTIALKDGSLAWAQRLHARVQVRQLVGACIRIHEEIVELVCEVIIVPLRVSILTLCYSSIHKLQWLLLALPLHPVKDGDVAASDGPLNHKLSTSTNCKSSYQVPVEKLLLKVQRGALSK